MNSLKPALLAVALGTAALIATEADAHGRYHHHHRSRASVGIFFGVPGPFFYHPAPLYSPRYYYHPPTVVVPAPAAPPVYIEQPQAAAPVHPQQSAGAYWYFCRDTQTYYPYVQQCATPWEQVVPQSPPPS